MGSEINVPPYRHTPKGMSILNKKTKCCDACECSQAEEEKFNKLMETQSSFEE